MVWNGPKWSKWSKMVKNGGPDLKRAQRTGLSARRARRTKSSRPEGPKAGPKSRKLEVGARRAPRLLVGNKNFYSQILSLSRCHSWRKVGNHYYWHRSVPWLVVYGKTTSEAFVNSINIRCILCIRFHSFLVLGFISRILCIRFHILVLGFIRRILCIRCEGDVYFVNQVETCMICSISCASGEKVLYILCIR